MRDVINAAEESGKGISSCIWMTNCTAADAVKPKETGTHLSTVCGLRIREHCGIKTGDKSD